MSRFLKHRLNDSEKERSRVFSSIFFREYVFFWFYADLSE
jgi:hypothetical protein